MNIKELRQRQKHNFDFARNVSTKMWDGIAAWLWSEHKVFLFHLQDGRIPSKIRDELEVKFNKKYGGHNV